VPLLSFENVTKRFERGKDGTRERVPVRNASLEIEPRDIVALVGRGRSGRSTALRLAGGIELASEGTVRFDGHEIVDHRWLGVPGGIGYCRRVFPRTVGGAAYTHVLAGMLALKLTRREKSARADAALDRVGASSCAEMDPDALDYGEATRVAIARELVARPRLLLVDDPVYGVDLAEVDDLLLLLRSLARDDGLAVFVTLGSGVDVAGMRTLTIDAGTVRGRTRPVPADIVPFPKTQR